MYQEIIMMIIKIFFAESDFRFKNLLFAHAFLGKLKFKNVEF